MTMRRRQQSAGGEIISSIHIIYIPVDSTNTPGIIYKDSSGTKVITGEIAAQKTAGSAATRNKARKIRNQGR